MSVTVAAKSSVSFHDLTANVPFNFPTINGVLPFLTMSVALAFLIVSNYWYLP